MSKHISWPISRRDPEAHKEGGCINSIGPIAVGHCHWCGWTLEVSEVDATLAAAAPDLLDALQEIIQSHRRIVHCEETHVPAAVLRAGEAAIVRATGGKP